MSDANRGSSDAIADRLHAQAEAESLRITTHAHQEMVEEDVSLEDVMKPPKWVTPSQRGRKE